MTNRRRQQLAVALGALVVCTVRVALAWSGADRIHPVDPAELKFALPYRMWLAGELDVYALLRFAGAGTNVHHGLTTPMAGLYGALASVLGDGFRTLRLMAALVSTAVWAVWVWLALRWAGRRAGVLAAVALLLPPVWVTGWSLTPWGSHPEAALLTGLWLSLDARHARALGALVGLSVGAVPVLGPTGLVLLAARRVGWPGWVAAGGGVLLTRWVELEVPGALFHAPVIELPGSSMPLLLLGATDPGGWSSAARGLFGALVPGLVSACCLLLVAVCGVWTARKQPLLVVLPLVHIAAVLLLSPASGPALRYLLPWAPAVLLWPAVALCDRRAWTLAFLLPIAAVPRHLDLWSPDRAQASALYAPWDYLGAELTFVPLERAPAVNRFLADRAAQGRPTVGFAAALRPRQGYPRHDAPALQWQVAGGVQGRLDQAIAATGAAPDLVGANAGWAIGLALDWAPAECVRQLDVLGPYRDAAAAGMWEGRRTQPDAAQWRDQIRALDRRAARKMRD